MMLPSVQIQGTLVISHAANMIRFVQQIRPISFNQRSAWNIRPRLFLCGLHRESHGIIMESQLYEWLLQWSGLSRELLATGAFEEGIAGVSRAVHTRKRKTVC